MCMYGTALVNPFKIAYSIFPNKFPIKLPLLIPPPPPPIFRNNTYKAEKT